jgi:ApaG protein
VLPSPAEAVSSSEATTQGIRVEVESRYSPERSRPGLWFFLYTVRISNLGDETVQLISRHWTIRDANGQVEEVQGAGVVGEQPVLEPGESYQYTSGCPLLTPFGSMLGSYQMVTADGEQFDAEVAEFLLREPGSIH